MLLWQRGLISAEVLEAFRVASAHDGRDPLLDLRELGLPRLICPPMTGKSCKIRPKTTSARDCAPVYRPLGLNWKA